MQLRVILPIDVRDFQRTRFRRGTNGWYVHVTPLHENYWHRVKVEYPSWRLFSELLGGISEDPGYPKRTFSCPEFESKTRLVQWLLSLKNGRVVEFEFARLVALALSLKVEVSVINVS